MNKLGNWPIKTNYSIFFRCSIFADEGCRPRSESRMTADDVGTPVSRALLIILVYCDCSVKCFSVNAVILSCKWTANASDADQTSATTSIKPSSLDGVVVTRWRRKHLDAGDHLPRFHHLSDIHHLREIFFH